MEYLIAPLILFMVVVAPLWLVLHYRHKHGTGGRFNEREQVKMDEMLATIDTLVDRIETLEAILDKHDPNWSSRSEAT